MNLTQFDGSNPAWGLYAARLCGRAYMPDNRDGLAAALELTCGDDPDVATIPVRNGFPAAIRGHGPEGLVVVISGITSAFQANNIYAGYNAPFLTNVTRYFCDWFWNAAAHYLRVFGLQERARNRDVFIFGHSAGGAVALALAAALRELFPASDISVVTFGGPRAASDSGLSLLRNVEITRWMNVGDDAVRLPPRYLDLTDLSFLALLPQIVLWSRFIHARGGLVLDQVGNRTPAQVPEPTRLLSVGTFPVSYLLAGELFGSPHSIAEYCRRIALGIPPKIATVDPKVHGPFPVGELPEMFQALTVEIPFPFPRVSTGSGELANPPIVLAEEIERRERFIASPIKRC